MSLRPTLIAVFVSLNLKDRKKWIWDQEAFAEDPHKSVPRYFMLSGFLLKAVVTREAARRFVMRSAIRLLSFESAAYSTSFLALWKKKHSQKR